MADFDYSSLLPVVDVLLAGDPSESRTRTAASRVYYSAYGSLRKRIVTACGSDCFDGRGLHGALVNICEHASSPRSVQKIGFGLKSLLRLRERADYRWKDEIEVDDVQKQKTQAGKLISHIAFLRDEDLQQLYRGIQLAADRLNKR